MDLRRFKKSGRMADKEPIGPVAFVVAADPDLKLVIFQFSKPINRLEFTVEQAMEIAGTIASRAAKASGKSLQQLITEKERANAAKPPGT